ncbi:MAG: RAMP superfamily CRISPR-associated protein [Proteobacteria bacterium]|nr:RAMP superfamily CRISPR-associated protein [Pseudomonadota bacterium]
MYGNVIEFRGTISLLSPLIIGKGDSENSDLDVIKDKDGKPFIPATSLAGVLREEIRKINENWDRFFGNKEKEQSRLIFNDLTIKKLTGIKVRDGIRIDNKIGIVEDKSKFDYEIVERGSAFGFKIQSLFRTEEREKIHQLFRTIKTLFSKSKLRIGAKTNNGFGILALSDYECSDYDLTDRKALSCYLKNIPLNNLKLEDIEIESNKAILRLRGSLINSFIIRDYSDFADYETLKSLDKPVITSSSLKGAIRARAEKILHTLDKDTNIVNNLFGYVTDNSKSEGRHKSLAKKGRVTVKETLIEDYEEKIQDRVKINRFTGGPINTALFNSMPVFFKNDSKSLELCIEIDCPLPEEVALILLVMKDLMTGDIALGGEKSIGRGRFDGETLEIVVGKERILYKKGEELTSEEKNLLNAYINKLLE